MAASIAFEGEKKFLVPARFWEDHVERACRCAEDCPERRGAHEGDYGFKTTKGYLVKLTALDASELRSDALYYSDVVRWTGAPEHLGLQSSARATVKRLDAYLTTFVSGA
jgi:hypothetical protein